MSLWYALPAVMLAYSAAQWVRRAEPKAKTISRSLMWLAFAAYCASANAFTTTLMVLMLLQWVGLQVYIANRANNGPHSPLTPDGQAERAKLSEGDARMVEFFERVKGRRLSNDEIVAELQSHKDRMSRQEVEQSDDEDRIEEERQRLDVAAWKGWIDVRFRLSQRETFPSADGAEIAVEANDYTGGWQIEELDFDEAGEGRMATCISELKFRGPDGHEWKVNSHFLLDSVLDLERFACDDENLTAYWWSKADAKTNAAMQDRCVIAGLIVSNDCRSRFPLIIGGKKHCIMLKYLSWRVDVALSESGDRVIVRVRELYEEVFDRDVFDESDPNEAEFQDMRMVNPFFYELPVEDFLPLFRKDAHFADRDSLDEWDGQSPAKRPLLAAATSPRS